MVASDSESCYATHQRCVTMVKVLYKRGPYHWIKKPYTPEEAAYFYGDAPYPYGGEKGEEYSLEDSLPAPRHLMTWQQEYDTFWKGLQNVEHIGFYGGAP